MIYLTLYWEFFKIGLFAIGGGLATLPFLYDFAERTGLITAASIADMIAISEATPGPIGVNSATYFGFQIGGIWGGIISTIGLITPSIVIILIISKVLEQFRDNKYVDAVLYGLRPASTALISAAGLTILCVSLLNLALFQSSGILADLFSVPSIILAAVVFICMKRFGGHPIIYIFCSAVVGIVFKI